MPSKTGNTKSVPRKKDSKKEVPEQKTGKKRISQNLLIAIIGASATVLAALLSFIPEIITALKPAPTLTAIPTQMATSTMLPPTATPTPTITLTPTPKPPTSTPTPETGIFGVYLAQDMAGEHKTTSFAPTQTIFLFFNINDPSGLNVVRVDWYAVDVPNYQPNTIINETTDTIKKDSYSLQANKSPWDPGKYKVELYLNDILQQTVEFGILK